MPLIPWFSSVLSSFKMCAHFSPLSSLKLSQWSTASPLLAEVWGHAGLGPRLSFTSAQWGISLSHTSLPLDTQFGNKSEPFLFLSLPLANLLSISGKKSKHKFQSLSLSHTHLVHSFLPNLVANLSTIFSFSLAFSTFPKQEIPPPACTKTNVDIIQHLESRNTSI